ncbi:MAG TPA: dihydroneopterin aldolase [Candidatus Marinimicrobia bacterium]|nr:dihydroneopterin aldolase [Candidatus Neomarinimicrobiota bacterium]HRS52295.1 dihydroneopterin aldolase [Candidatus Neomarinimicrobiota bacterium]HRU92033.1 dihydroneopterin aldolase [Candidatus Neomarinimicrobiota bacterium]
MGIVRLNNMVFYGYHGVAEPEKILGGKIEVDVELEFDMTKVITTDHLTDTINYEKVYQLVQEVVTQAKFFLIEALAGKILNEIFNHHPVESVRVRIRKPNAPIKGVLDTVEVEIFRRRDQMGEKS